MAKKQVKAQGKACLCKDGSYSSECCGEPVNGQGIGSLNEHTVTIKNNVNTTRTRSTSH